MHDFKDLVYRSTSYTLNELHELEFRLIDDLHSIGSTIAIKNLQMIQLQKTFMVIGMFSYFESYLQREFSCDNGFKEVKCRLKKKGLVELNERFEIFNSAINVLKHGTGRSYDFLISKSNVLPFKIKQKDQAFFFEGDMSEVDTLIDVDNTFILNCAKLIDDVLNGIV